MKNISRRNFLRSGAMAAAGLAIVPNTILGKAHGYTAPSDKLNIAGIGVGGMGRRNLKNMSGENIVALCDVDWGYAKKTFNDFPKAKTFRDWRDMFDSMNSSIDAIMVATPDHTHAGVAAHAMTLGKHVYLQKPLAHSAYECRLLAKLAAEHKVATQMGNQANSFNWCREISEWIQTGIIGEVTEVHVWTNRPVWPQGLNLPTKVDKIPKDLDWKLFLGPAADRPFSSQYTPWNWRGWYDFGTGAMGDMHGHLMDPVGWALDIKYPTKVIASSTLSNLYSAPHAEIITWTFPERPRKGNVNMPEVKVSWYDGGLMPPRPAELKKGEQMGDENGGMIFIGSKGKLMAGCYGMNATLLPSTDMAHFAKPKPTIPRVKGGDGDIWSSAAHEHDWIRACKESANNRTEATSNFQFSGPMNEMISTGVTAVRLAGIYGLHQELEWDGENMEFTNISPNEKVKIVTLDKFDVIDGDPRFDRRYEDFNALEMAKECIKHTYHNGFRLPNMPK